MSAADAMALRLKLRAYKADLVKQERHHDARVVLHCIAIVMREAVAPEKPNKD